ncbi:MAG: hypothetical protein ATN31_02235 [Candidatus Epulonipiscioides saccharophilum]|nr:MAG: hypothetical protein ATN31_02235 [Epulopiscium sp. AS2M-Bin001]
MTDREIVRDLAKEVAELANEPRLLKLKDEWIALNDLHVEARPMISLQPDGECWREIIVPKTLICKENQYRQQENFLRRQLFILKELKDDTPITATFPVHYATTISSYGSLVVEKETSGHAGGSYHYKKLINNIEEDFDKLDYRKLTHDVQESERRKNFAEETLGDILKVEFRGEQFWTSGLTWEAIKLIGLEELMLNMYDDPEGLHKLMHWLMLENKNLTQQIIDLGVLNPNHIDVGIASGGYGWTEQLVPANWTREQGLTLMQKWGFAESQETVGISPDMFGEFIFPYQLPLLERYGLNCYGCCEPVEGRWKWIQQIPRLRRVSVSPWSDINVMKDILKKDYIYSRKVSPSYLCVNFDEPALKRELKEISAISNDIQLEITMKDVRTVQNDPSRCVKWVEMARSFFQ